MGESRHRVHLVLASMNASEHGHESEHHDHEHVVACTPRQLGIGALVLVVLVILWRRRR